MKNDHKAEDEQIICLFEHRDESAIQLTARPIGMIWSTF